jgi:hypothetical protein
MRTGAALLFTLWLAVVGVARAETPARIALQLSPAAPVKGLDTEATLTVRLTGDSRQPPPVLRANVGTLGGLERLGPGTFRAAYRLPATRYPEVAIIVAFAPWPHPQAVEGALGVLRVPLASAVDVPGRAEPGARVTLALGGKTFGPVEAAADGTFRLPVVVPPGFGVAQTTTVDRARNRKVAALDLRLPPTDQLACVMTPSRLPADGATQARLLCATSDRYGAVARGAKVQWRVGAGALSAPEELGDGITEWRWTAPRELGSGAARLVATWRQGAVDSREELPVELSQGPVRSLSLVPEEPVAHQGGVALVRALVRDGLGRPLPGVRLEGEGLAAVTSDADGGAALRWPVPTTAALGPREVRVRATGPVGREPARLLASAADGGVAVAVLDLAGLPVPGERLLAGDREWVTGADGVTVLPLVTGEVRHAEWPGLSLALPVATAPGPGAPGVDALATLTVVPPVAVNVRLRREGATVRWWLEAPDGRVLDGREVELRTSAGVTRERSAGVASLAVPDGRLTITDLATRATAVLEAAP